MSRFEIKAFKAPLIITGLISLFIMLTYILVITSNWPIYFDPPRINFYLKHLGLLEKNGIAIFIFYGIFTLYCFVLMKFLIKYVSLLVIIYSCCRGGSKYVKRVLQFLTAPNSSL